MGKGIIHLPCNDCGSSDALTDYGDTTFCFSCLRKRWKHGYKKRRKILSYGTGSSKTMGEDGFLLPYGTNDFTDAQLLWLLQCGITLELQNKYKLLYIDENEEPGGRILIPIWDHNQCISGYQSRTLDPTNPSKYITRGQSGMFWTKDPTDSELLVLTEDAVSAIRVEAAQGQHKRVQVAALLGLRIPKEEFLTIKKKYATILLWLDSDRRGQDQAKKLAAQFRLHGTEVHIQSTTTKEPKQCHNAEIREILEKYFPT